MKTVKAKYTTVLSNNSEKGLIFNIQKFSVHDGPGIRDLVFLKGCPLRCRWCSNPESQKTHPEIAFNPERCIGIEACGLCIPACPDKAIKAGAGGKIDIDRKKCDNCGKCVDICPAKALNRFGEEMSVDDIVDILEQDSLFHSRSGGGVTLSGGDPIGQADYVYRLLRRCKENGMDTAIETAGYGPFDALAKISRFADLVFYDIKTLNPVKHREYIGVDNAIILKNLKEISIRFPDKPIVVRTPIIPGFNDTEDDIRQIARFIKNIKNVKDYELLKYHRFGQNKYRQLDRTYPLESVREPTDDQMAKLRKVAEEILDE